MSRLSLLFFVRSSVLGFCLVVLPYLNFKWLDVFIYYIIFGTCWIACDFYVYGWKLSLVFKRAL